MSGYIAVATAFKGEPSRSQIAITCVLPNWRQVVVAGRADSTNETIVTSLSQGRQRHARDLGFLCRRDSRHVPFLGASLVDRVHQFCSKTARCRGGKSLLAGAAKH